MIVNEVGKVIINVHQWFSTARENLMNLYGKRQHNLAKFSGKNVLKTNYVWTFTKLPLKGLLSSL